MPSQQQRRSQRNSGLEIALRLARAVAAGEVRAFVIAEAEAVPGVRSAALVEPGPVDIAELGTAATLALPIGGSDVLIALLDRPPDDELELRLNQVATLAEPLLASERRISGSRRRSNRQHAPGPPPSAVSVLVVDDDPGLRTLLRVTFEIAEVEVAEAANVAAARAAIAERRPDVVVLDVQLPDSDGLTLTRELRADKAADGIGIVLLTGGETDSGEARMAGADALVRKPFSPLELLDKVRRVAGAAGTPGTLPAATARRATLDDQLLLYAGDLRRLLDVERRQRHALGRAYRETLGALANALETRDTGTAAHSVRVQRYASEIARAVEPALLEDPSVEYGFLLHDIGKIGIPDQVLRKPGKLTSGEWQLMQTHAPLGAGILADVRLLRGEGLGVVRHHHEHWDGSGYPDRLVGEAIPLAARVFAVADAVDAITTDRPYRKAQPWSVAVAEIEAQSGRQFDPGIVEAFLARERSLRHLHREAAA